MRKLLIFFILFIFSMVSFSGNEVEEYVLEQHNKIFKFINDSENLLKEDRIKFLEGLEDALKDLIISKEISKRDNGSDLGPVLNWNPQTGSLQLSQNATQKLLASLGGHVTQRRDTGLTVFFPISDSK